MRDSRSLGDFIRSSATVCVLMIPLLCPALLPGQAIEGSITGSISDATGSVLPGVTLTAVNQETGARFQAVSDASGRYTLLNLRPGSYRLRVAAPGFKTHLRRDILLRLEQAVRIDIRLEVGEIIQEVVVTGDPPLFGSEAPERGKSVTHEEVNDLPIGSREFYDLAYLTAGVVPNNQGGQGSFASINGARADSINFIVDGGNNNILRGGDAAVRPSLNAVQEFTVRTSSYSAEYGRRGSGVVSMILRSGTNRFHGSIFEYHRNALFDARNFFDRDKSRLIRHSLGGNLGGPLRRNRMFFFINYEAMRLRAGQPQLGRVPTLMERRGDFREGGQNITDPLTGKILANRQVPANRIDPVTSRILQFYPLPNQAALHGQHNFYSNKIDADDFDDWVGKVDYNFFKGHTLSARYLLNDRNLSFPYSGSILPGFGDKGPNAFQMAGLNYTHLFRPTLLTQVGLTFARKRSLQYSINAHVDYGNALGIPGLTKDPALLGFPRFTITNYATIGDADNMPLDWTENNYQVSDTTTLLRGPHSLRVGGEVVRTQYYQLFADNSRGSFSFLGRWTGDPFADFLLGLPNNTSRRIQHTKSYLFVTTYAGYLQDDWRVSRRLTVSLGVRWDLFLPPYDKYGKWANFVPEQGRVIRSGENGFPASLVFADRNNFAPRIGFAWKLTRHSVLRGGYGTFFGTSLLNPVRQSLGANPPFSIRETYSRVVGNPSLLTLSKPFPDELAKVAGVNAPEGFELHTNTPRVDHYNLTVDYELSPNMVVDVAYAGSKGTHLGRRYDVNQPLRTPALAPGPFPRPFAGFSTINYYAMEADSNYHALQAGLRRRGRGMNLHLSYSFSKSIDDASQLSGSATGGFGGVQDSRNRAAERALSDFDRRHAFTGSVSWGLPYGNGEGRRRFLLRNWQVNSILRIYSGNPLTPQLANYDFNAGEAKRPDRIGAGKLANPSREQWFKISDFVPVLPGAYRFGNSGRGVVSGPSSRYLSASLMRYFRLGGEHRLLFRWEVFNLPNLVNFRMPNANIDTTTAGVITAAGPARQMQVSLRYTF